MRNCGRLENVHPKNSKEIIQEFSQAVHIGAREKKRCSLSSEKEDSGLSVFLGF